MYNEYWYINKCIFDFTRWAYYIITYTMAIIIHPIQHWAYISVISAGNTGDNRRVVREEWHSTQLDICYADMLYNEDVDGSVNDDFVLLFLHAHFLVLA